MGRKGAVLGARARERIRRYPFPGNVRELRNVLERALVLEPGPELELLVLDGRPEPVPGMTTPAGGPFLVPGSPIPMEELERRYARHVLEQLGGRRVEAAKALGLSYPTFLKRIED